MRYSLFVLYALASVPFFSACKDAKNKSETKSAQQDIIRGKLRVVVDESVLPIMSDQVTVFESSYTNSEIELVSLPEIKAINYLLKDSANTAVLTRKLSTQEEAYFLSRQITPRIYQFATDALVFIKNNAQPDTSLHLQSVKDLLSGKNSFEHGKLVLDNANGANLRLLKEHFKLDSVSSAGLAAVKTSEEVLRYISENPAAVGVVSLTWILQAGKKNAQYLDKIRTLSIQNEQDGKFYKANQTTIALNKYPLLHPLYFLNYQASQGLGVGFSAFVTGERGQRMILKAGILPQTIPGREIIIRNEESIIK